MARLRFFTENHWHKTDSGTLAEIADFPNAVILLRIANENRWRFAWWNLTSIFIYSGNRGLWPTRETCFIFVTVPLICKEGGPLKIFSCVSATRFVGVPPTATQQCHTHLNSYTMFGVGQLAKGVSLSCPIHHDFRRRPANYEVLFFNEEMFTGIVLFNMPLY